MDHCYNLWDYVDNMSPLFNIGRIITTMKKIGKIKTAVVLMKNETMNSSKESANKNSNNILTIIFY